MYVSSFGVIGGTLCFVSIYVQYINGLAVSALDVSPRDHCFGPGPFCQAD